MLVLVEMENQQVVFKELNVNIDVAEGNFFVTKEDIEESIFASGYTLEMDRVSDVDIRTLEASFDANPSIKKAEVFRSLNGVLHVKVDQRKPLVRIFTPGGDSYYIDESGFLMPLSNTYTSRVIVANGEIYAKYSDYYQQNVLTEGDDEYGKRQLKSIYELASFIRNKPFWQKQIAQVYWNEEGQLELIPRVGRHRIVIGKAERLEEKFTKLMVFYKEGLNKTGWNDYSKINLEFKNQVVCTKR